jgi:hypothetical protein
MTAAFETFWKIYPRREGKAACLKKWVSKNLDDKAPTIVYHLQKRVKEDAKWLDGYIPMALTFISQERWDDEYETRRPKHDPVKAQETYVSVGPQTCLHRATLNLLMLNVLKQKGGVDLDKLRAMVLRRNELARQMSEMWGTAPVPQDDWAEMAPGFLKALRDV